MLKLRKAQGAAHGGGALRLKLKYRKPAAVVTAPTKYGGKVHSVAPMRRGEFRRERLPDWFSYAARQGMTLSSGGTWRSTLCDFHDDNNPSLRVNTMSGGW